MSYNVHIDQHGLNHTRNGNNVLYDHMIEGLFLIDGNYIPCWEYTAEEEWNSYSNWPNLPE